MTIFEREVMTVDPVLCSHWTKRAFSIYYPGVRWVATPDAPQEWEAVRAQGDVIEVWDGASDRTIYESPEDNYVARAWHDSVHRDLQVGFDYDSEALVALTQCTQLRAIFAPESVVRAIEADTLGQLRYHERYGEFVDDQLSFARDVLAHGMQAVIESGRKY